MPRSSTALTLTGPSPASAAAASPATTSASRSRRVIVLKSSRADGVQADVHPVEPGLRQRPRGAGQAQRVGGDRGLRTRGQRRRTTDDVGQAATQQRLAAGEPDLAHAEPLDRDRDQPDDLVVGEHVVVGQPVQALGRHAVGAPQVAAVGERHPQVGGDPPEAVGKRCRSHAPSLRGASGGGDAHVAPVAARTTLGGVRFMVSRRWALFAVVVVVLAYACYLLGQWQFHRLHDREATTPRPAPTSRPSRRRSTTCCAPGRPSAAARRVAPGHGHRHLRRRQSSVIVRYQTRDGASGVDVVTPLRHRRRHRRCWWTAAGCRPATRAPTSVDVPGPPAGDGHGRGLGPRGRHRRRGHRDRRLRPGHLERARSRRRSTCRCTAASWTLETESPKPAEPLVHAELPDLGNGPHFFYGLQWWFFGVLAVFGFCYLAYDERKKLRTRRRCASARRSRAAPRGRAACRRRPAASRR